MFNGRLLYVQVLFVVIAFAIMVAASYMFGANLERMHLEREAEDMFTNVESRINSNLQELETMLSMVSETIRGMLLRGADLDEIKDYMVFTTDYALKSGEIIGFISVFAYFDIFDGFGYNGAYPDLDWTTIPGFVSQERPWYLKADKSSGETVMTDPYLDMASAEDITLLTFSYARPIFDYDGNRMAIICIDVALDRIYEFASMNQGQRKSYWMLFDSGMHFLAHPNEAFLGVHLSELGEEHAELVRIIESDESVSGHRIRTYTGETNIISGRELENGWFMGVASPMDNYYENLRTMMIFLSSLGLLLSALLSLILVRIVASRNRAEERNRIMLDSSPLCIGFWNKNYEFMDCNKTSLTFFGVKDKHEYKARLVELIPEYQPDGMLSFEKKDIILQKAFDEGFYRLEWLNRTLDGEPAPVDLTMVRVRYKNDYVVVAYMRDLRDEKKMEKKVAEHGTLLTAVNNIAAELLPVGEEDASEDSLEKSLEHIGRCVDGDRVLMWRGTDNETLIQRSLWMSDYGATMPGLPADFELPYSLVPEWIGSFRQGKYINGPVSKLNSNMRAMLSPLGVVSVLIIPLYLNEKFWGIFTIDNCRVERVFSEEETGILKSAGLMMMHALNRSEMLEKINEEYTKKEELAHWYHSILDEIPLPISVTDEKMNWTFINRAVENFLGMKRKDLIGWQCSTWGSEICNTHKCGIACLKRGEKQTFFSQFGRSYKVNSEMLKDLNGEASGFIEIVQDITETESLFKKQAEAEAASNAKSAFLATVSHEIRTPMNTILGIAEIQLQNDKHPPEVDEAFNQICDSGDLLLNIINDILDVSKIEAGKLDIVPVKYDIPSLINDNAQLNYLRYESKPIKFKINLAPDTPQELFGDEFRIKQILNNLLSNAFKYTDEGEVELSVFVAPLDNQSDIEAEKFDTTLIIRVKDTGVGMTEQQINILFDEFTRFTEKRTAIGTGLGMSITKRLVDMMNGTIKVESEPDKGSVFEVSLPQKRTSEALCGEELSERFKNFSFKSRERLKKAQITREYMPYGSVLIVDDMIMNLQVAKGMMSPYSLKIETVMSGIEAVEIIKSGKKYDIIFMDHMMPVMNGIEATKEIRGLGYKEPIVALTANALAGQEEMFLQNGFDGFISKPIDSRELNTILNDFIRNRKPREIVEAARLEQSERERTEASRLPSVDNKFDIPDLGKYFAKDAESAVAVLEKLLPVIISEMANSEDMDLYVTTVHGMKSSLANIGERELSGAALKLEQAGIARNNKLISDKTPMFITVLKSLIEKFKPEDEKASDSVTDEDKAFLRGKLREIKSVCERLDKKRAKELLGEIKQKARTSALNIALDDIEVHLLHSAFKKAAAVAEEAGKSL